jgi:hypothetical protein
MSINVGAGIQPEIKPNVLTKRLPLDGYDSRRRVGLIISEHTQPDPERLWHSIPVPRFGIIMERTIEENETTVTYGVHIADGAIRGRSMDYADLSGSQWWVYLIISADIERILRREAENNQSRGIVLKVSGHADNPVADEFTTRFLENAELVVERTRGRIGLPLSEAAA